MKTLPRTLLGALLAVLLLAGTAVAFTWAPDKPVSELKARWAPPPSRFIDVGGLQVHLRDEGPAGDPVPIVLLHGTSASLHTWDGWAAALRGQRRVIRFDLPGFGLTGPHRENDYSTEAYVRFVRAVLDQLGVQRAVLVGNSLGGQIAWSVAAAMPRRIERLVLLDASGYPPESATSQRSVPIGFRIAATPGLRVLARNVLPRSVIESSLRNVYGDPGKVTPALVDLYADMALREGNREALGRRMRQGYSADASQLKNITAPTLVIWGGRDRLVPQEFGPRFVKDISNARLVVFPALGHIPHEEDPAQTAAEFKRFLGMTM